MKIDRDSIAKRIARAVSRLSHGVRLPVAGRLGADGMDLVVSIGSGTFLASVLSVASLQPTLGLHGVVAGTGFGLGCGMLLAALAVSGRRSALPASIGVLGAAVAVLSAVHGQASFSSALLAALAFAAMTVISDPARALRTGGMSLAGIVAAYGLAKLASHAPLAASPDIVVPLASLLVVAVLATRFRRNGTMARAGMSEIDGALAHMAGIAVIEVDRKGNSIAFATSPQPVFGLPAHLLVGDGLFGRIHVTDRVAWLRAIDAAGSGGEGNAAIRVRMPSEDGDDAVCYETCEISVRRDPSDTGRLLVFALRHDPAAALREEIAELRKGRRELESAKSSFLAAASHELRTPLNAINGFADLLLLDVAGPLADARQREYVELIRESGSHLLSVVNTILDMSKIESGHYTLHNEDCDGCEIVQMAVSMVAQQASKRSVSLDGSQCQPGIVIHSDRRAVRQVLINLLSNAVKFSREGGTVSVSARVEDGNAIFAVQDHGIGMSKDFIARLGTPFLQEDNAFTREYEGTGLGFSVVRGLVGVLGGKLNIDSREGEGTTVTVSLPVAPTGKIARTPAKPRTNGGQDGIALRKSA